MATTTGWATTPLLAIRADTGEVLPAGLRKSAANTARGILRFVDELIARLCRAGASGELPLRMDSGFWSWCAAIAAIPEHVWDEIAYQPGSIEQVAETPLNGDRLIVLRARNPGDQQQLFPTWRYHAFVTNRVGTTTWVEAHHRRHAVCELAIRDLKACAGWRTFHPASSTPTPPGCWRPP
jgi:hypothetical protein